MNWSRYQVGSAGVVAFAGAGSSTTTILAAPGTNAQFRLFAFDIALDEGNAVRVRYGLRRSGGVFFARGGMGANQPSDHNYFGEGGYPASGNTAIDLFVIVAAACDVYWTIRYITEGA